MFYDEQPVSLRIALRQRIRWAKGHLQAFAETGWPLWKHVFTLGVPVVAAGIPTLMQAQEGADLVVTPRALDSVIAHGAALLAWAAGFGKRWLRNAVIALYVFLTERQHMPALPWYRKPPRLRRRDRRDADSKNSHLVMRRLFCYSDS